MYYAIIAFNRLGSSKTFNSLFIDVKDQPSEDGSYGNENNGSGGDYAGNKGEVIPSFNISLLIGIFCIL